jgi:hypothetical protein
MKTRWLVGIVAVSFLAPLGAFAASQARTIEIAVTRGPFTSWWPRGDRLAARGAYEAISLAGCHILPRTPVVALVALRTRLPSWRDA